MHARHKGRRYFSDKKIYTTCLSFSKSQFGWTFPLSPPHSVMQQLNFFSFLSITPACLMGKNVDLERAGGTFKMIRKLKQVVSIFCQKNIFGLFDVRPSRRFNLLMVALYQKSFKYHRSAIWNVFF